MRWPLIAFLGICMIVSVGADEPTAKPPTDAEIKSLVDQLVNPNPRPKTKKGPDFRYPKDFDHDKERKVDAARRKLHSGGARSISVFVSITGMTIAIR